MKPSFFFSAGSGELIFGGVGIATKNWLLVLIAPAATELPEFI